MTKDNWFFLCFSSEKNFVVLSLSNIYMREKTIWDVFLSLILPSALMINFVQTFLQFRNTDWLTEHWGEMRGWFNSEVGSSQTFSRPFLSQIRLIFWSSSCILLCCWLRRIIWLVWWRHSDKNTDERINFFRDLKF